MTNADLETHYRAYLAALNERRLDDLVHYVQDELSYNDDRSGRRRAMMSSAEDLPTPIPIRCVRRSSAW